MKIRSIGSVKAAIAILASGFGLALFGILWQATPVAAQVSAGSGVGINVADTLVRFTGKAARSSFITVRENGNVIGTTFANGNGDFTVLIGSQARGIHAYEVNARDNRGVVGDPARINVNITPYITNDVSAFLPTTIRFSGSPIQNGQGLFISGQTAPGYGGKVVLIMDESRRFEAIVDGFGHWNFEIETYRLRRGTHSIYATAYQTNGAQSYPTGMKYFTVGVPSGSSGYPTGGNPTVKLPRPSSGGGGGSSSGIIRRPIIGSDGPGTTATPQIPQLTMPRDGSRAELPDITVAGTADPDSQIEIWNENRLVGSVVAKPDGSWSGGVTLQHGPNAIKVRSCKAKACSDFSRIVVVIYEPQELASTLWLMLNEYRFLSEAGAGVSIAVTTGGGKEPYDYTVAWGDGRSDTVHGGGARTVLTERYDRPGLYEGTIRVEDSTGKAAVVYFSVHVTDSSVTAKMPVVEWSLFTISTALLVFVLLHMRLSLRFVHTALLLALQWLKDHLARRRENK